MKDFWSYQCITSKTFNERLFSNVEIKRNKIKKREKLNELDCLIKWYALINN